MASSYLTGLSACVGLRITLSDSAVSMVMTGAIITALIRTASRDISAESALAITFQPQRRNRKAVCSWSFVKTLSQRL